MPDAPTFTLQSDAFTDGGAIPSRNTCDGLDLSPALTWSGIPLGTKAYALIVDDPDAGGFIHWVLFDIGAENRSLPEGRGDTLGVPGRNDFRGEGWRGPCPPSGEHRYVFTVYALSAPLKLAGTPPASAIRSAMTGKVLAQATLTGVYRREH